MKTNGGIIKTFDFEVISRNIHKGSSTWKKSDERNRKFKN